MRAPGGGPDVVVAAHRLFLRSQPVVGAQRERNGVDADDVGFPAGVGQHPRASAADHDRRVRTLHGLRSSLVAVDVHVVARTREFVAGAVRLDERDDLLELGDASARGVEGNPIASYSTPLQPAPIPSSSRPSDSRSRVAISFASTAGT